MSDIEKEYIEKCRKMAVEIMQLLEKNKIKVSHGSAILGSVFAIIACKTEENFPFISFLNSFIRTYSINYDGTEIHEVANLGKIFENKK